MKDNIYNKIVSVYLCIVLICMQIGMIGLSYFPVEPMYFSYMLFYLSVGGMIIYLYYKLRKCRFEIKDFFIMVFIFFSFLSFYFAYDRFVAYNGFIGRREGLLALISYYILFLVASTLKGKKNIKIFIACFSCIALFEIIYGFLQVIKLDSIFGIPILFNNYMYSFGLIGNSNFYSSFQLLILGIWIGIYYFDDKLFSWKIVMMWIFFCGLVLSGAMSGFVGLVLIILALLVYIFIIKIFKKKKIFNYLVKIGVIIVSFVWAIAFLSHSANNRYAMDIFSLNQETTQIAQDGLKEENGTGRIFIWKTALKNAPKYLVTGIGIDQFLYINDGELIIDPITKNVVDKAHNEYLQILLTEGIFKCITYILFLLWIFFKSVVYIIKSKKANPLICGLLLSFMGYAVQAFFNISVITVAPIFFITGGLLLSQVDEDKNGVEKL